MNLEFLTETLDFLTGASDDLRWALLNSRHKAEDEASVHCKVEYTTRSVLYIGTGPNRHIACRTAEVCRPSRTCSSIASRNATCRPRSLIFEYGTAKRQVGQPAT